ncbi:MAG: tRNA (N(6)-L-threonylcarbamoyladenosine(37)-C(2))-methylthiotransferase MtaB [Chloroflexia bacterium]
MPELLFLPNKTKTNPPESSQSLRVAFVTLGCKVNQSDTQKAIADFRAAGFRIVSPSSPAEVYVVNTCSVTHIADRKSRQWLRRGARANPDALVVATGCYAESGKETLQEMDEVGLVVGYKDKDDLLSLVLEKLRITNYELRIGRARLVSPQFSVLSAPSWAGGEESDTESDFRSRTRAMVKIEDGCNDFCTFCIIPFTRGMPRSTPTNQIVDMVNKRIEEGYKEIVLTGVHMGKYGQDHAQCKRAQSDLTEAPDLPTVIKAILERTEVARLRITSLEPTDAVMMLPLFADPAIASRLAPHLHLPLQSGCDATLARMKRDYTTVEYEGVVRQCREAVPGVSITTDLITGFPGEDEYEWAETRAFVESMEFAKVHVFPFSRRPGTPAFSMENQVPDGVRHARTLEMRELGNRAEEAYAVRHLGTTQHVLWEHSREGGWNGLTANYVRVRTHSHRDLQNCVTPVTITAYDADGLWAEVLS